jgi:hypothetical protein
MGGFSFGNDKYKSCNLITVSFSDQGIAFPGNGNSPVRQIPHSPRKPAADSVSIVELPAV